MKVSNLRLDVEKGRSCLSADVGGERVHLTAHDEPECVKTGDAFVMLGIINAMERGETLTVADDIPVSASLLRRLRTYQEIYTQWWPKVKPVAIVAPNTEIPSISRNGRVGCFFSGGVDSVYSVVRNLTDLTDLVLCRGLDIPSHDQQRWDRAVDGARRFAESVGKRLVLVESDAKARFLSLKTDNHGAVLISCAMTLGLDRLIVPASFTYDKLFPWGSHPMLDPLLSTDYTEVEHDGAQSRTFKTRVIAESKPALDQLRVCNVTADYNCGKCEKCLRTMAVLSMIGVESASLPPLQLESLTGLRLEKHHTMLFWDENLALARELGNVIYERAIERVLNRYHRREKLREIDRRFLNEAGVSTLRRLRGRRR